MGAVGEGFEWIMFLTFTFGTALIVKGRWLFALPISRHTLFAIMLAPLGAFALGNLLRLHYSSQPGGVVILDLTAVAAACLLGVCIVQIPVLFSREFTNKNMAVILTWGAASLAWLWTTWRLFRPETSTGVHPVPIEIWFRSVPPASLPLLIVTAIIAVGALYWLAYAGFRRMEIRPQRMTPVH